MSYADLSVERRFMRFKIQLRETQPLFAALSYNFEFKADDSCSTMAVRQDRVVLYNEDWVQEELSTEAHFNFVVCHELLHWMLEHTRFLLAIAGPDAKDSKLLQDYLLNHQMLNIAMDLVINDLLITDGFEPPAVGIMPKDHRYEITYRDEHGSMKAYLLEDIDQKSTFEIYHELQRVLPASPTDMSGSGQPGDHHRMTEGGATDGSAAGSSRPADGSLSSEDKELIAQVAELARQQGKLSGSMGKALGTLLSPKVAWTELLLRFLSAAVPYDYTYVKPHRKSWSAGTYLPSMLKENMDIIVHIDTSGSMSEDIDDALSQVYWLLESYDNIKATLIQCDAEIQGEPEVLTNGHRIASKDIQAHGFGGTSHQPVVDWVCDHAPNAQVLVTITDGYSDIPECFPMLPGGCHRIILLPAGSREQKEALSGYGTVVVMGAA